MSATELRPFHIPMRRRFRRVEARSGVLVRGSAGWGEFSPFPDYGPQYAARWLQAARAHAEGAFPEPVREVVPVNASVPATTPREAFELVASSGCTTAKVKVAAPGDDLAADLDRVAAVRRALGVGGQLRIDANGAWDVATAAVALKRLDAYDLQYAEQPVATLEEMRQLGGRVRVPLAVDESLRTAIDPVAVAGSLPADVLVVKVQPLGGLWRALEVVEAAPASPVVSSALETSVGLSAGLALAGALEELELACGLGTAALLVGDVTADPLEPDHGVLRVRRPDPDPALLDTWSPPPDQAGRLLEAMRAADEASGQYV